MSTAKSFRPSLSSTLYLWLLWKQELGKNEEDQLWSSQIQNLFLAQLTVVPKSMHNHSRGNWNGGMALFHVKVQLTECQYWLNVRGCHVEVAKLKREPNTSKKSSGRKLCTKHHFDLHGPKMQTGLSGIKRNIWERKTPLNMFPSQFQISKILTNKILKFQKKFQTRKVGTVPGPINLLVATNKHLPRSFKVTASCLIVGPGGGRHYFLFLQSFHAKFAIWIERHIF